MEQLASPSPAESTGAAATPPPLTARQLRKDRAFAPGGNRFAEVVNAFLPLVHGVAAALLPGNPAGAENTTTAVFQTFALRWRRLPRKTFLAAWFLRSTMYAALHQQNLESAGPISAGQMETLKRVRTITRLSPKFQTLLLLGYVLGHSREQLALSLDCGSAKLKRMEQKALGKLSRKLKLPGDEAAAWLRELASSAVVELPQSILEGLTSPGARKSLLVRKTTMSWRWLKLRRFLGRIAQTVGVLACLFAIFVMVMTHLARKGFFIQNAIRDQAKQALRANPEMGKLANPLPPTLAEQLMAQPVPTTAAKLYTLTNIWPVKFSFTRENWERIKPSNIPPVENIFQSDGTLILRNPKASRSGLSGVIGIEFNWTQGDLQFGSTTFPASALRYRGNGTYINSIYGPKQSFKADLNKFKKGQKLADLDELNFLNSIADYSYVRDALAELFFRGMGAPGPRTAYAFVTIDVPGVFTNQALGLYVLMENIDKNFAEDRFGTKKTPIFKPVTPQLFEDLGDDWAAYADIYDLKTEATDTQKRRIVDFSKLATHAPDDEFAARLPDFLDMEEFAAFLAGHVILSSYDGFLANGQNFYIYLDPKTDKIGFIPWDQDHSWGEFGYMGSAEDREQASIWDPAAYKFKFLERVLKVEAFRKIYREKIDFALRELFTVEKLYPQIDQLAATVRPAIEAESGFRLRKFDIAVSGEWTPGPRGGAPEGPNAPVHQIKRFIENRTKFLRDQLDGKSEGVKINRRF